MPPDIRSLLEDNVYQKYFNRVPKLPENIRHGNPWRIVARRMPGAPGAIWALKDVPTYADAWRRVGIMMGTADWEDIAIVSRRKTFRPPVGFEWNTSRYEWCGRCRRPSIFRPMERHPAMRDAIVLTVDEAVRCFYCGARRTIATSSLFRPR